MSDKIIVVGVSDGERFLALNDQLVAIARAEGGEQFLGWPDRWYDKPHWRCINGHVSTMVIKSEALRRDACPKGQCFAPVHLTFPEDLDGPLQEPTHG